MTKTKNKINIVNLAEKIKSNSLSTEKVKLADFFDKSVFNEWVPNPDKRIQVRAETRDIGRINRAINKIQSSGDDSGLEKLTCVRMPNDELLIINGSHTSEIEINIGYTEVDAYVVDWEKDLGGKLSNAKQLGNLLNLQDVEKVDVHDHDVRNELYQLMDEKKEEGLPITPTEEELAAFVERYPGVTRKTLGQWMSNHSEVGGRRKARITYTAAELHSAMEAYKMSQKYVDYAICSPIQVNHALDTGLAKAFDGMLHEKKRKVIVLFYCGNAAQVELWKDESHQFENRIKKVFKEHSVYWDCTIEYDMIRYE